MHRNLPHPGRRVQPVRRREGGAQILHRHLLICRASGGRNCLGHVEGGGGTAGPEGGREADPGARSQTRPAERPGGQNRRGGGQTETDGNETGGSDRAPRERGDAVMQRERTQPDNERENLQWPSNRGCTAWAAGWARGALGDRRSRKLSGPSGYACPDCLCMPCPAGPHAEKPDRV